MADRCARVLREREFRLLWLGQSASTIGDRLVFVALALYVTEIGSPTDVGIVLAAHADPVRRVPDARRRVGRPAPAAPRDGGHRPRARGDAHAAGGPDPHRHGGDLAHRRDRGRVRRGRGVLPPRVHRARAADRARVAAAGRQRGDRRSSPRWPSSPARRWPPRSCWASAPAGRSRSTRRRSSSPALFLIRLKPRVRGAAVEAGSVLSELRAGWSEFRARAWVWGTVAIFSFLLIFAFAPLHRARADGGRGGVRRHRLLRRAGRRARRRDDRRRADRPALASGAAAADGVRVQPAVDGGDRAVRRRRAAAVPGRVLRALRRRAGAVRRLVADRAGAADPAARAVARVLL